MNRATGRLLAIAVVALFAFAACGGSDDGSSEGLPPAQEAGPASEDKPASESAAADPSDAPAETSEPEADPTLRDLLDAVPGDDVAIIWGTGDLEPGEIRMSFLVVDDDGELAQAPTAELVVGKIDSSGESEVDAEKIGAVAVATSDAILESIDAGPHEHADGGAEPHDHIDATDLYVAKVDLSEPGLYWAVATPSEGEIQAFGTFEVLEESVAPSVGEEAFASDTPTLDDAPAEVLTTLEPPAEELLRYSIADSLADSKPFIVTFATPAFCQTRVCGPVVQTVENVRGQYEAEDLRFIQVEIYIDNDPNNGVNEWVQEWGLPSEPWTFLVDESGVIQERFEGGLSAGELVDAIERKLL
jgi:hypothetical protein